MEMEGTVMCNNQNILITWLVKHVLIGWGVFWPLPPKLMIGWWCFWHLRIWCALLSTELTRAVRWVNDFSWVPMNPCYNKEET